LVFDRQAVVRVDSIRVFGCDTKERAADYFGPVRHFFELPRDFLSNAAYGDLIAAALALASIFALRSNWRVAVSLVWVFNTWGFVDLLNGLRGLLHLNVQDLNPCYRLES
jgi:hypothetical protein